MNRYEIVVTETKFKYNTVVMEDRFKFRPDKKWKILQRLCFWVLKKIGAYVEIEDKVCVRHVINPSSIGENLIRQRRELVNIYDLHGKRVLVGPEEYQEITGNPETFRMLNFSAEYHKYYRVMGMKLTVVPWMKGILVIPNLD